MIFFPGYYRGLFMFIPQKINIPVSNNTCNGCLSPPGNRQYMAMFCFYNPFSSLVFMHKENI